MTRSFRYRLLPTRAQAAVLLEWLRLTRELYNAALEERRDAWRKQRISVSLFDQTKQIAAVRAVRVDLIAIPVAILRSVLRRLDRSFAGFFRRCKRGLGRPGFPRFKSARRWTSIPVEDLSGWRGIVAGGKRVGVPGIGKVKLRGYDYRPLTGQAKAMHLTSELGKWFITFVCTDVPARPLPACETAVGVDLGLMHFAATSDGEVFENPRPLKAARIAIERAQRRVSRRKRGGKRRRAAVCVLARKHARVANLRREGAIELVRNLVARYGTIYVEDLNIQGLAAGMLAKSVHDAAWGTFLHWLRCKAESAGREVVEVDLRGTSQTCSRCGCVAAEKLSLAVRVFRCAECGYEEDRDVNAARNILRAGTLAQGAAPLAKGRRRSANFTKATHRPGHARHVRKPSEKSPISRKRVHLE